MMRHGFYPSKWLLLGSLLYGLTAVAASDVPASASTSPLPETRPAEASSLPESQPDGPAPFIGVILPLQSRQLGPVADAIKAGINAAVATDGKYGPAVRFYPANEQTDDVLFVYRQAQEEGARAIIGPLTKPAIAQLVRSNLAMLPTLALNTPDNGVQPPATLYSFGLGIEQEARQIARQAWAEGKRRALSLALDNAFGKRLQTAFNEEWKRLGGELTELTLAVNRPNYSQVRSLIEEQPPELAFLAVDARRAKLLRPYLGELPLYATSQISNGRPNSGTMRSLAGLSYVEMPWFLEPQRPEIVRYPRPARPLHIDLERMYALGIDAWRLASFLVGPPPARLTLEGVSGRIELTATRQLQRQPSPVIVGAAGDEDPDPAEPQ